MICPRCSDAPLIALEVQQLEVDYCAKCSGLFLDIAELALLFGDAQAARDFLESPHPIPRSDKPVRCPECRRRMEKAATASQPPIIIDRCRLGDGLWLDRGELEKVLAHADPQLRNNEVAAFLFEVFRGGS